MGLSRIHFKGIAKTLAESKASESIITGFVFYCKSENPNFSETKFRNYIQKLRGEN
jgi:hypothetical protein